MIPNLIRRFVIMAVAVPLAAFGARKLSAKLESRHGQTRTTRMLSQGADFLQGMRPKKKRRFAFTR